MKPRGFGSKALLFSGLLLLAPLCLAQVFPQKQSWQRWEEDFDTKKWEEIETQLPPAPKAENLRSIYVSATTANRFAVDIDSISIGSDGVARYTLVVETAGGARNVSYEGMRCNTKEQRPYAFGRTNGTWSKARNTDWNKIREAENNRHHAALFVEYFCPDGIIVRNKEEALGYFRQGGKKYTN